ncbi:MAG: DUF2461 domain-containing protein [Acidobacteriia bacterium]|nr:DUF2461 domain-containing protein [Terriglobia bacterium]
MAAFAGFPPEGITFLRQLKRNNNREWFQARKPVFEEKVKEPMTALVSQLNAHLARTAPEFITDPKRAIYRFYRDTRFSNDKTPYKTHIAALFVHRGLDKHASASLYCAISPDGLDIAGGVYMPQPEQLLLLRTLLAGHHKDFDRLTTSKQFARLMGTLQGSQLSRIPKGFDAAHPAADLLKRKQWYFFAKLDAAIATSPKLVKELTARFDVMQPFLAFMNAPLVEEKKKQIKRSAFSA